ncbi:MAG TPA: chromosomal replication initiator protein DnaA [Candidatus Taylorbacteria bacterium]|nr:MAG: Chromosomal replication initiator protein DnaA [Parcubacteria group bacterium GW2011_GWA2_47_64]KKU96816.1 MAG: Chromosomal replication initiator protein DnaA [Parcubacteria group bacterium GW2011_GWC2_48_17]HBV01352.1 chromosomal replication initiator protein DnaA [Candidatus Taylorbacteria bacterium]
MNDIKKLWEGALLEIELSVSKANFTTWFKDTSIARIEEGIVYLSVPNTFVKDWLLNKYHKFILRSLRNISEQIRALEYTVTKEDVRKREPLAVQVDSSSLTSELPIQDYYVDKETNLNPRYTFDSFIVGPFNELAHAAALAIIKSPGITYNPLFVYGSTGHGKTHLIQAIGNKIRTLFPNYRIFYMTSEKFSQEFLSAMQNNRITQFKEKYRQYDCVIMDDIQFFSEKERSQEELFHLFNELYAHNKQIIFSSDRHPNYIQGLEERLKSRFAAGMTVDIPPPDRESRVSILKAKARLMKLKLADDAAEYISAALEGNIRELEGMLNSIMMKTEVKGGELGLLEIKEILKNTSKPKKALSAKEITKVIADFYSIDENHIYEKTRRKEVVKPRQLVMYILREDCRFSFPLIGQKLGGRDHTTVIHSCEKIRNEILEDPNLLQEINQIRALL